MPSRPRPSWASSLAGSALILLVARCNSVHAAGNSSVARRELQQVSAYFRWRGARSGPNRRLRPAAARGAGSAGSWEREAWGRGGAAVVLLVGWGGARACGRSLGADVAPLALALQACAADNEEVYKACYEFDCCNPTSTCHSYGDVSNCEVCAEQSCLCGGLGRLPATCSTLTPPSRPPPHRPLRPAARAVSTCSFAAMHPRRQGMQRLRLLRSIRVRISRSTRRLCVHHHNVRFPRGATSAD